MQIPSAISIESIGYSLGESCSIEDLVPDVLEESAVVTLAAMGLGHFRKATNSHLSLVSEALNECLKASNCAADQIDQIIISSHTFLDYDIAFPELLRMFKNHGIAHIPISSFYMSRCASAITCIRHAVNQMLSDNSVNNILIILVDKCLQEVKLKRTLNNGMAVFSDGASAFMLRRGAIGSFVLQSLSESVDNEMVELSPTADFVPYLQTFSAGLKSLVKQMITESGLNAIDFKYLIAGNYNASILRNYAMLAGFKSKQIYCPHLSDIAHSYSSDLLITLDTLRKEGTAEPGDQLLLLATGSFQWGGLILNYHGN